MSVMPAPQAQNRILPISRIGNVIEDSWFIYAPANPFTFVTGLENFQVVIPIQSDAHFICKASAYTNSVEVGNIAANTSVQRLDILNGGAIIQLTDGGNNRFLSNVQVPLNLMFGDGRLPHLWEFTFLFRANTSIGINITGTLGAAQVIRLAFYGMKIPVGSRGDLGL
jgi:hypothetical protein